MINCPECGLAAMDGAKFCDRCGQGLNLEGAPHAIASITPLVPGTELKGGYRVVAPISQTARESRYHAERDGEEGVETFMLREQPGPVRTAAGTDDPPRAEVQVTPAALDPAGPRAKTADLKLRVPGAAINGAGATESVAPAEAVESTQQESSDGETIVATNPTIDSAPAVMLEEAAALPGDEPLEGAPGSDDLGEVFGRVLALSQTLSHPAFQCAQSGFADGGRVYLVYPQPAWLRTQPIGTRLDEGEALNLAIQLCQAVAVLHRRGLRVNDICPEAVLRGPDGRIVLTGLDYVSNDDELHSEPIFNDGYTAPEIYRAKRVDKRADIFAIGALLYTWLTGERIEAESWRGEAGPVRFYPPHVVTPALEQVVRRAIQFDPAARWATVDALKAELVKLGGAIRIRAAAFTDVGMVRELNEDAVMTMEYRRDSQLEAAHGFLYVIADGMGGAEAGEIASAIAVGTIREQVQQRLTRASGDAATILQEATEAANRRILDYASTHPEARGMGSTAVGALIHPPDAAIAWVGDSRAYHCGDGGLRQISKDHSLVQRLVEIGQITAEEARHHEHKNVITRSLGARPNGPAGVETSSLRLKRGDRLLLCSDGLTAHVEDPRIAEILRRNADPDAAARELVVAANAGGGTDNVSVVVIFAG